MDGWEAFSGDMQQFYGLDLDCLRDEYYREQVQRVPNQAALPRTRLAELAPCAVATPPKLSPENDCLQCSLCLLFVCTPKPSVSAI